MAHAGSAAWFVALAVIVSYPLIRSLDTHVTGAGAGDNLAFLWNSWWARQVATAGDWSGYFRTDQLFAPFGTALVLHTHTALESVAAALLLRAVGTVRAHNLMLIAGLAANGFAAYLLAFAFVRRAMPAIVAGTSFATCAYATIHLLGHVNLVHAWVLPLAALAWVSFVRAPSSRRAVAVALAFAAALWTDYYAIVYAVLFATIWLVLSRCDLALALGTSRWPRTERILLAAAALAAIVAVTIRATSGIVFDIGPIHVSALRARNPTSIAGLCLLAWVLVRARLAVMPVSDAPPWRRLLLHAGVAIALFALLAAPVIGAALALMRSGGYVSQQYDWRSGPRGADLLTSLIGPPMHSLTGAWTSALDGRLGIDRIEQTAWLGLVVSAVLAVAMRSRAALGRDARRWLWVAALFLVWSLGPSLSIGGIDTGILLPQSLARYVPVLANARMPGRALVMVQLAAAVLAAMAIGRWSWRAPATVLASAAIVLESLPAPFPLFRLPAADRIDARLAGEAGAAIELPSGLRDGFGEWGRFDARALAHQMNHGRPLAGGFLARIPPGVTAAYHANAALSALFDFSAGTTTVDALPSGLGPALAAAGVVHVIVNTDLLQDSVREPFGRRGLVLVLADGSRELYAVPR